MDFNHKISQMSPSIQFTRGTNCAKYPPLLLGESGDNLPSSSPSREAADVTVGRNSSSSGSNSDFRVATQLDFESSPELATKGFL